MKWNVGTKIGVGFGVVLLIFVIVGVLSYRSTTQLIGASQLRQHAHLIGPSVRRYVCLEITNCDPFRNACELLERPGDIACDDKPGQCSQDERYQHPQQDGPLHSIGIGLRFDYPLLE